MKSVEDALISIRPIFADAIFNGSKTVELRRKIPPIAAGVRLWIYVTKPVGAVKGVAEVSEIIDGSPDDVWRACAGRAGLDRAHFDAYFHGSERAFGLVLRNVNSGVPAPIELLKTLRPSFHPPQVITRLSPSEASGLRQHIFHD